MHIPPQVGKRVYNDFAEQTTINRKMEKFPQQEIIGFRIVGMRVSEYDKTGPVAWPGYKVQGTRSNGALYGQHVWWSDFKD